MRTSLLPRNEEFAQIYERNFNNVYQVCYLFLKNKSDAEDITQNTFMKLYQADVSFQDLNHEKAWLILTAKRLSINNLKHWWRKVSDFVVEPASCDFHDETMDALLKLPDKYKVIIYMHYYMGYKTKEIASLLKQNESTVRTNLMHGRDKLKKIIEGENYE